MALAGNEYLTVVASTTTGSSFCTSDPIPPGLVIWQGP